MSSYNEEDEVVSDNEEIIDDIKKFDPTDIVVYSRDWTIETILSQIKGGNIDLNPKFQRRNAWNDHKRSKLIESILIGYPVPEIVLAEDPKHKKSFAVIDGKQRLLTIAGFADADTYEYWDTPQLNGLSVKANLNKLNYSNLSTDTKYSDDLRQFLNASLRCTIITNFKENDILYDIFYRLNSGSVPLSTQELRQVLNKGEFANYLISVTNTIQPLHNVMKLSGPDKRLRDIEVLLRYFAIILFGNTYSGNLKVFLDTSMDNITKNWEDFRPRIDDLYTKLNNAIELLRETIGDYTNIGRKHTAGKFEKRFNRVLFEVQIFFFIHLNIEVVNPNTKQKFLEGFKKMCETDPEFRTSIESSTKSIDNYKIRFSKFQDLVNESFSTDIDANPFK